MDKYFSPPKLKTNLSLENVLNDLKVPLKYNHVFQQILLLFVLNQWNLNQICPFHLPLCLVLEYRYLYYIFL